MNDTCDVLGFAGQAMLALKQALLWLSKTQKHLTAATLSKECPAQPNLSPPGETASHPPERQP